MHTAGMINKYPKLILFIVVFILYGNTLKNGYAVDDNCVTTNDCITSRGVKSIPKIFKTFYTDRSEKNKYEYRPLVKVSFAMEHQFFGVKPSTSHFFNLLLYFVCLIVLLKWLKMVFENYPQHFAFLIVLTFAIMPIHTEVVANIKNRDILLCFMFVMLGSISFFKAIKEEKQKIISVVLSVLFFYAAFLSKLDLIPYFAIIPVIAAIGLKAKPKWIIGFVVMFIISFILFRTTRRFGLEAAPGMRTFLYFENPLFFEKDFLFRFFAAFNCLGFYTIQCILPLKQSYYYGLNTIPVTEFSFFYGSLGVVVLVVFIYGSWWAIKNKAYAIFYGFFIFLACISMYLNLVLPSTGIVSDRFCFSASLGIAMLFVGGYQLWVDRNLKFSTTTKGAVVLVGVFFAVLIIQRNAEWKDLITLTDADVKKYPESAFLNYKQGANIIQSMEARNNMQLRPENQKQVAEARANLEKAISVYPAYPEALNQLTYLLVFMYNDFKTAVPYINRSLSVEYSTEVLYYKGICYRELNKKDSSEIILLQCIKNEPTYQNAYDLLVYDYNAKKQYQKSIDLLENALKNGFESDKIRQTLASTKQLANLPR